MKHGISLDKLAAEVMRQQAAKLDYKARTGTHVRMDSDGSMLDLDGLSAFLLRPHTHRQIAEFCDIKKPYYDKMQAEAPGLLAVNVNHWFNVQRETRLIRTLDGQARAFMSTKFRPLDNSDLMEASLPALMQHQNMKIESCELTERRLYLKAIFPRLEFEVRKGDVVQFGLQISNSEIGDGALEVAIIVLRLVCLNGMVVEDGRTRRNHIGGRLTDASGAEQYFADETRQAADRAFFLKLRDTVKGMLELASCEDIMNKLRRSAGEPLRGNPVEHVEVLAKRAGFTEDEKGSVLEHLIRGGDLSQWGLINAVTAASQDVADYDRASELERIGGRILNLSSSEWREVAIAA